MDLSSSLPESQQRLRNHDHQQFPDQSTAQSYYYHQQNQQQPQYYAYNLPPGYTYHQVPHQQNLEPAGFSVNSVSQIADSVCTMAQVGLNPVAAATVVALSQLAQFQGTVAANFGAALLHHGPTLMPPPPAS